MGRLLCHHGLQGLKAATTFVFCTTPLDALYSLHVGADGSTCVLDLSIQVSGPIDSDVLLCRACTCTAR